jgi:hypothetical protein
MAIEFQHDGFIFSLDGRVMDIFRPGTQGPLRYHVAYMGVHVQPKGDEYRVRVGPLVDDLVLGGATMKMDAVTFERFRAFIAHATTARDGAPGS